MTGFPVITDAKDFGRVAVLMGGSSAEREISLMSGQAVLDALLQQGVAAIAVDPAGGLQPIMAGSGVDRVWIALHGRGGEDGTLQGLLSQTGLPHTGSGVLGCALAMDKLRTKRLFAGYGLPTPEFVELRGPADFDRVAEVLGFPVIVKPADEGSSIGLTRVDSADRLPAAWTAAADCDSAVFAERWITGGEYTAAVLHDRVLPLIRIDAKDGFYDYEAKYFSEDTRYICPCGLPADRETEFADLALKAFNAVGASGWGRVDFMLDDDDTPLLLEVNTVPGMTSHSLVPMAAAEAGMDFGTLVWRILETSFTEVGDAASA
jgi:D-alanine-D-alanine ligase